MSATHLNKDTNLKYITCWTVESETLGLDYTMSFEVSLQVIEAYVSLGTQGASVGAIPCMLHGMFFQFTTTWKTFAAFRTYIWALPSMNTHMNRYLARHGESLLAHRALVWPFPGVGASVYLQLTSWYESLATVGAQIRLFSCVNSYVDIQISWHGEAFSTVWTLKWLLTCVTAHVKVQVMFVLEGFATACTNLCFLLSVAQLMSRQTRGRAEKFATLRALIGQLGRMNLLMGPQVTHAGTLLPTLSACEITVLPVGQLMLTQQVDSFKAFPTLRAVMLLNIMHTLVSKFVPNGLKTLATFDANIICPLAMCPSVAW